MIGTPSVPNAKATGGDLPYEKSNTHSHGLVEFATAE